MAWTEISALRDRAIHEVDLDAIRLQLRTPRRAVDLALPVGAWLAWVGALGLAGAWAAAGVAVGLLVAGFLYLLFAPVPEALEIRVTRHRLLVRGERGLDVPLHRVAGVRVAGDDLVVALRTGRVRRITMPARSRATQTALVALAREATRGASTADCGERSPAALTALLGRVRPPG